MSCSPQTKRRGSALDAGSSPPWGRTGNFDEHRIEHIEGRKISFLIDADQDFGVTKMLEGVGASFTLAPSGDAWVVAMIFFHRPKTLLAKLMNPLIRHEQRKNRLKALAGLREFCERRSAGPT